MAGSVADERSPSKPGPAHRWVKVFLACLLAAVVAAPFVVRSVGRAFVSRHQRGVIRELDAWRIEFAEITSDDQAERAEAMLRYILDYYVVDEGYHSDPKTDAELEAARDRARDSILTEISRYHERKRAASPNTHP